MKMTGKTETGKTIGKEMVRNIAIVGESMANTEKILSETVESTMKKMMKQQRFSSCFTECSGVESCAAAVVDVP